MARQAILLSAFVASLSLVTGKSPPLTKAIPFDFQSSSCPLTSVSCAGSINQAEWCCPSDGRCVFGGGGIVACCEYSITCADEGSDQPETNPGPISSPPQADATTVMPGGVAIVTVSPSSSVIITNVNQNWGVRDQKGSHIAWIGVLLALAWTLRD